MDAKEDDVKYLISLWETLSELWEVTAARHKQEGHFEIAVACMARQYTFKRCARDLRAITNIHGDVAPPPPTIPGMDYEEHQAVEKTLKGTKLTWMQKIKRAFRSQ